MQSAGFLSNDESPGTFELDPTDSSLSQKEKDAPGEPAKDIKEDDSMQPPTDWAVYVFFLRSMGLFGASLFFILGALLAAEQSFQSM